MSCVYGIAIVNIVQVLFDGDYLCPFLYGWNLDTIFETDMSHEFVHSFIADLAVR